MLRNVLALSLVLGLCSVALGVNATWGEECDGAPSASTWVVRAAGDYSTPGFWTGGGYGTEGLIEPLLNEPAWTMDVRFKTNANWNGLDFVMGFEQECGGTQTIGVEFGQHSWRQDVCHTWTKSFDAQGNGTTQESWNIPSQYPGALGADTWYLARVVCDPVAGTMTTYLDGQTVFEQLYLGPNIAYSDHLIALSPGYKAGSPSTVDYMRVYPGALEATAPLDAVPEPMTLSLLGLGGLALIRRRR
jgi:hypothetical protein